MTSLNQTVQLRSMLLLPVICSILMLICPSEVTLNVGHLSAEN
jgi:hypothetical protein